MSKEKMKSKKIEVKKNVVVAGSDIDDIVTTALEGGICYWCSSASVVETDDDGEMDYFGEYASEQISRGGSLELCDSESDEVYILTLDKMLEGIKMYLEDSDAPYDILSKTKSGYEIDTCMVDAEVADMIVQYALFGEVQFG